MADGATNANRLGGSRFLANSTSATGSFNEHTTAPEDNSSMNSNVEINASSSPMDESVVVEDTVTNATEPHAVLALTASPASTTVEDQVGLEDFTTGPTEGPTQENTLATYYLDSFLGEFLFNATIMEAASEMAGFRIDGTFLTAAGNVFFLASTTEAGTEPWVTDGTLEGTRILKDIYPGAEGSMLTTDFKDAMTTEIDGNLLFFAQDGVNGNELWKSDGTEEGTLLVRDMEEGENGFELAVTSGDIFTKVNGTVYYSQSYPNNYVTLLQTDGTSNGTHAVREESTLFGLTKLSSVLQNAQLDSRTYIAAEGVKFSGKKLWMTSGTRNSSSHFDYWVIDDSPKLMEFKDKIYFGSQKKLFYTDGTLEGTNPVADGLAFLKDVVVTREHLFFVSSCRLWSYGGETKAVLLVPDVPASPSPDSDCRLGLNVQRIGGNSVLFVHNTRELWISDGTVDGTRRLSDNQISPNHPNPIFVYQNNLAFIVFEEEKMDGVLGDSLWASDGAQLERVLEVGSETSFRVHDMVVHKDNLLIAGSATKGGSVTEMWRVSLSDSMIPTPESTVSRVSEVP